ncbi:UDP-N-acetylmuramate dehydrogenase [Motilibacter sp. E257]|uniref:UDP-N-acetylenolpyruvoylglucosamine reductase n=1 Tax=Motilibacter deserti TaxID=2714956 RepID=A0ABX0GX96_9ACTN|nr:UDP-N-acetylmuramate dehydrogenase [Motilibacter deserti]NHC15205.1 UDP-N-acetylmuramate dehydrogenase [Motilibacter deserti]
MPLAALTTLRVGGPARRLVRASSEAELIEAVRSCDEAGEPLLVLGGGSNVLVADAGFAGTVVLVATSGTELVDCGCGYPTLRVAAGEDWDAVVVRAVEESLAGIECLSGIPGTAGATPVQNVGAYGQEVSSTVERVRAYDRVERRVRTFPVGDCGFGYRTSRFKQEPGRYVVLEVEYALRPASMSDPVRYAELARALGIETGARAPLPAVREAVLALRAAKGMVLDADDPDTWSAGSFFTNPVLAPDDAAALPAEAPRWPAGDGLVKVPAAWLIEQAGFGKGYGTGLARLSTKHTLALTNRGGAAAADLAALAREVRDGVRARFGIELVPEPVLVGLSL